MGISTGQDKAHTGVQVTKQAPALRPLSCDEKTQETRNNLINGRRERPPLTSHLGKDSSPQVRNKTRTPTVTAAAALCWLCHGHQARKRKASSLDRKKEKDPAHRKYLRIHRKLPQLTREFTQAAGTRSTR